MTDFNTKYLLREARKQIRLEQLELMFQNVIAKLKRIDELLEKLEKADD